MTLSINMTEAGAIPRPAIDLFNEAIATAQALYPGLTAEYPAQLIYDLGSTMTGGESVIEHAVCDLINSIDPLTANVYLLNQLCQIYGVVKNEPTNTSVEVVFTGTAGFAIRKGFTVSDGTHQYYTLADAVIKETGESSPVFCVATTTGSWAVPAGTVTTVISSTPDTITLTCTNPLDGIPSAGEESFESLRVRTLNAGNATATGTPLFIKNQLLNVYGVQDRLISFRRAAGEQPQIVVGGGDAYEVGAAIFRSVLDVSQLAGSTLDPLRDVVVDIVDGTDTYSLTFIRPFQQIVEVLVVWDSPAASAASNGAFVTLATPGIVDYVNSILVGKPLNVMSIQQAFMRSIAALLPAENVSRINVSVTIDDVLVTPDAGTEFIYGSVEGYFFTTTDRVTIQRWV